MFPQGTSRFLPTAGTYLASEVMFQKTETLLWCNFSSWKARYFL